MFGVWSDHTQDAHNAQTLRELWKTFDPFTKGYYVNTEPSESEQRLRATSGDNYPRLVQLKNKYDPGKPVPHEREYPAAGQVTAIRGSIRLNTMRVAMMQPYFFPYIGYFQLMAACDLFLVFDDAYIDRGWVNRNRILVDGWRNGLPLQSPQLAPAAILEREYLLRDRMALRLPSRIASLSLSAVFRADHAAGRRLLAFPHPGVAAFNTSLTAHVGSASRDRVHDRADVEIGKGDGLVGGERRVIDICLRLGATAYINPIGGRHLYSAALYDTAWSSGSSRATSCPTRNSAHRTSPSFDHRRADVQRCPRRARHARAIRAAAGPVDARECRPDRYQITRARWARLTCGDGRWEEPFLPGPISSYSEPELRGGNSEL